MEREDVETLSFTLHLLDSAHGHRIQSWQFENQARVTIGRSPENDISLADSQVSRLHAELRFENDRWTVYCHGRNGMRINSQNVTEHPLEQELRFQLGSSGPTFQYMAAESSSEALATIENIDIDTFDFLSIDEERTEEDVQKIVEGDIFQQLQQQAQRIRQNNSPYENPT